MMTLRDERPLKKTADSDSPLVCFIRGSLERLLLKLFSVKRGRLGYCENLTLVDGTSLGNLALFPSRGLR